MRKMLSLREALYNDLDVLLKARPTEHSAREPYPDWRVDAAASVGQDIELGVDRPLWIDEVLEHVAMMLPEAYADLMPGIFALEDAANKGRANSVRLDQAFMPALREIEDTLPGALARIMRYLKTLGTYINRGDEGSRAFEETSWLFSRF